MEDLRAIVEYHEQALRSIEDQLGRVVERLDRNAAEAEKRFQEAEKRFQEAEKRLERLEHHAEHNGRMLRRAFHLGVIAYRRERERRRHEDERLEQQRARDRAEWQERMTRIEANLDRFLSGLQGANGREGPPA